MDDSSMEFEGVNLEILGRTASDSDIRLISTSYECRDLSNLKAHRSKRRPSSKFGILRTLQSVNYTRDLSARKLRVAASYNDIESVNRLLTDGLTDPNVTDEQGRTALHIAASRGYAAVVEALIRGGADPNAEDKIGNTPLHLAVYAGSIETVSHLLAGGCRPRRTPKLPYTPLELARSKYSLLFRQGNCTLAKTQVHRIVRLLMEEVVQSFYHKLNTEVERRREIENVLDSLSSLDLENTSLPASPATQ